MLAEPVRDKLDPARCEHCRALKHDTNVNALQRLSELGTISAVNLCLALFSVIYLGCSVVSMILNTFDNDCYPCPEAATTTEVFHRIEFTTTFLFALVTTIALVFSPERRFSSPLLLRAIVLMNVCVSFIGMALVYIALEKFMTASHELEYMNELCMAIVDLLIVLTVLNGEGRSRVTPVTAAALAVSVPVLNLALFNLGHERKAHYVEFAFNMVSAAVSFWLCTDSMLLANRLKIDIMLAPEGLVGVVVDEAVACQAHRCGQSRKGPSQTVPLLRDSETGVAKGSNPDDVSVCHIAYTPPHLPDTPAPPKSTKPCSKVCAGVATS
uniref:Uncharacterized protein n=1 Tax=Coccolithus braarudii TaxID=221442 RepID=A0A7S0Q800_9EUKA